MSNRNITLSMPDDLVRGAKVLAATRDTSVSALVADLLRQVVGDLQDYDTAWRAEEAVMDAGLLEVGDISWSRDDLHVR